MDKEKKPDPDNVLRRMLNTPPESHKNKKKEKDKGADKKR